MNILFSDEFANDFSNLGRPADRPTLDGGKAGKDQHFWEKVQKAVVDKDNSLLYGTLDFIRMRKMCSRALIMSIDAKLSTMIGLNFVICSKGFMLNTRQFLKCLQSLATTVTTSSHIATADWRSTICLRNWSSVRHWLTMWKQRNRRGVL
jgi:hypothetical protein